MYKSELKLFRRATDVNNKFCGGIPHPSDGFAPRPEKLYTELKIQNTNGNKHGAIYE